MRRVGLTGGIATGKSAVVALLRARGVPCVDADALAHAAMGPRTAVTAAIVARFGDVREAGGGVDRARLGPVVFADAGARRDLEAIVHPAVAAGIETFFDDRAAEGTHTLAVADVPLLYEVGWEGRVDHVLATCCAEALQMERLRARGVSEAEARSRMAAQWPARAKAERADAVIQTDGSMEETAAQVDAWLSSLGALGAP